MKKRKYRQLKRNPLVRLIRLVLRFFKTLFKSKKGSYRSTHLHQPSSDEHLFTPLSSITELGLDDGRAMTVGELLEQVKWQLPRSSNPAKVSGKSSDLLDDSSLN